MFFTACLGNAEELEQWRRAASDHARWLGLSFDLETRKLPDGGHLGLGWFVHRRQGGEERFVEAKGEILASTCGNAGITLRASLRESELACVVPLATPQHMYYARIGSGWVFADDLRFIAGLVDARLDPRAIYLLLQYGAVPPGLALYTGVGRVPNGHTLVVRLASATPRCIPLPTPDRTSGGGGALYRHADDAERAVAEQLDAILEPLPWNSVLYFSGGVDSGLLAARLAQCGRQDVRLISFAFDTADDEHRLAVRMASHLGFTCERVSYEPRQAVDVLERAGRDYSFPFGDISTIPTNLLVHASLPSAGAAATVIEGTGADGAFGLGALYEKWHRAYRIPQALRRQVGKLYDALGLWRADSRVERLARFVRKSAELPLPHSVLAQNALQGIAYDAPAASRADLAATGTRYLEALATGATAADRLTLFDLMWVCAGRMAPKSFDPLRSRGIRPVYPFLDPGMVSLSTQLSWDVKCPENVPKGMLKRMLARDVPADMVYRRKMGFTRAASARAVFRSPPVQEFLQDVVLSAHNPLREFCRMGVVRDLIERARHDGLSVGAHSFLWTVAFVTAWLGSRDQDRGDAVPLPESTASLAGHTL